MKQSDDHNEIIKKKMNVQNLSDVLYFRKTSENAFEPERGSAYAAGLDLKSAYDCAVPAHGRALVKTDLQIQLPTNTYGRIAPRSGLALKHFIDVGAGVIDEDYRGDVGVILFNHSDVVFKINRGDRIAQLICEKIIRPVVIEKATLDDTERGENGFGSTGV